jgi:RNA polymerase sigma-70 factor (ECF subfamily)
MEGAAKIKLAGEHKAMINDLNNDLDIEQSILQRCVAGDHDAFRILVEQLKRPAYYHALSLLGHPEDAMDISQEAFVRAWQAISSFEPGLPFYPWYYTIMKRLALNLLRTKRRHPETAFANDLQDMQAGTDAEQGVDADTALAECSAEERVIRQQTRQQVRGALTMLSIEDREILCLKDMHDYAYKDIAFMLSIPLGTVMSRLYAARSRLRNQLRELGYEHSL